MGKDRDVVLIVDDVVENLHVLNEALQSRYRVLAATSGASCLEIARGELRPDIILLDVMMPDMNGYNVLSALRQDPRTKDIPVIFLTALTDEVDEEYGLRLGATDYITKPVRPFVVLARVEIQLQARMARDMLRNQNEVLEAEVLRRMSESNLIQQVSIRALAHLAEIRDPETGYHILRTQGYIRETAMALRNNPRFSSVLTDSYVEQLSRSAPLHDIGKVGIPDFILLKEGGLTPEEWQVMKTHAKLGSDAIERAEMDIKRELPFLTLAKEIARWHHERWDGSGYPDGLMGDDIPLSARLMAIADVFDALISKRSYKVPMPFTEAREVIMRGRGAHFDPDVTDMFIKNFDAYVAIAEQYQDSSLHY